MKKIKNANDYAKDCLKPPKGFFEWCYQQFPTYVWKNKRETIVASTRKHSNTYEKRLAKNSRLTFFDKCQYFIIILSSTKKIEIQTYEVYSFFEEGKQMFKYHLFNLERLVENKHLKVCRESNEHYCFGKKAVTGMFNYYVPEVYPNGWIEKLGRSSELKYLDLRGVQPEQLPHIYKYRERIEFAQKIGAKQLAQDIMNKIYLIDMRVMTKNWLRKFKKFFQKSSRGYADFLLKKEMETRGIQMILGIEKYVSRYEINDFFENNHLMKLQTYLLKQEVRFSMYRDYLNMLNDEGIKVNNKNKYPDDLEEAHDKLVDIINARKTENEKKKFVTRAQNLAYMERQVGNILFILPKSVEDIRQEGKELKHCVASYIDRHAKGETTILFARKIDDPSKPYFTLEFKDGKIVQVQSTRNRVPVPEELREAISIWEKELRKKKYVA